MLMTCSIHRLDRFRRDLQRRSRADAAPEVVVVGLVHGEGHDVAGAEGFVAFVDEEVTVDFGGVAAGAARDATTPTRASPDHASGPLQATTVLTGPTPAARAVCSGKPSRAMAKRVVRLVAALGHPRVKIAHDPLPRRDGIMARAVARAVLSRRNQITCSLKA